MVAFQEASSATYSIVKYDILSKSRFDHSPDEDHIDDVNAMSCCARMRITASASSDGTVRIWNEANRLIRIIKLNATPLSVCFCSQKGDLLVGIGKHLHKIEHQKYMPRSYMLKMVSMRFPEVESEDPLPYDGDLLHDMNREDVKRLKNAHSSLYKFDHFVDVLTDEENEELTREKKVKEKEFALLANRDDELKQIRDGLFPLKKKPKPPPKVKEEAFKKYLELFPKPKQIFIPKDDYFNPNAFMDVSDEPGEPSFREFSPMGFFPNPKNTKLEEEEVEDEDGAKVTRKRPLPVNPSGFIPNSVLIRLLWPLDQTSKMKADTWRPPALSEDQVAEINARKRSRRTQRRHQCSRNQTETKLKGAEELAAALAAEEDDYDSEAKKIEDMVEREEKEKSDLESASIKSTPKSGLFSKLAIDITRTPTPKEVSFDDFDDEPTPPPTPSPEIAKEEVKEQPKAVPKPKVVKIKKTITKFVSRPKPPLPSPSPPPQPTPSPPRLPTPLPGFISQFKGAEWFEKFFPNADSNTFPKPWTATAFSANLLKLEKIADYETKTQIADALMTLHNQDGLSNSKHIADTILGLLNTSNPPNAGESDQKAFILHSLRLLGSLAAENDDTVIEMMAQYLDGDEEIRNYVRNMFLHFGLQDPHNFFYKELDSWELWSLDDATNRKEELKVMASNWIDKWMEMFKSHISRTIELLKKGKVSAKISKAPSSRVKQASPSNSRGILKKDGEDSDNSDKGSIDGGDTDKISPRPPSQTKPLTVTFEAPPDQSTIDNAKPIEAINYFAEMQLEKQLEKMRSGTVSVSKSEKEELERRNTVLVLPKIKHKPSLVRLGETHTSKCRPHRETSLAAIEFKLPSLYPGKRIEYDGMYGFTPKIDLPMKTVVMNPFPSAADYYEELHQPILLTLKSSQKYFVPGHSYVRQAEMR
uniref:Uncharacterized protein LOC100377114 n=1 Tax=Saccoglossus kowalevskii TaxID=10224 RepID=A0ABM0M3L9_SACKO|nr:PREDICTED: uncharacterized protein LOC100377114 [Saccoglossus kowalevskii]